MLQPGQIIGDMYRIERLLGSGGMADVFVVKHVRLPKHFALKVMRLDSGERTSFLERFRREAEILATLKNPHLVDVFDRNEMPDGNPYLVMELLEGEDLSQFLMRSGGPLSVSTALSICNQVGEALDAAHQVGIVHRDLKPSNIFLCQREAFPNFVKVLDFGIAKQNVVGRTPLTAERSLMGTPGYMAPEQALGKIAQIDHRTDQFALAAILYEMLAGKPAFYGPEDTTYSILTRVVNEQPPPLPHAIINRAVQRALSKNTDDRYPSIKAFLSAAGANSLTIHIPPNVPEAVQSTLNSGEVTVRFQRGERPRYRSPLSAALLSIGVGTVLAGGLLLAVRQWRQSPEVVVENPPHEEKQATPIVTPLTAPSPGEGTVEGAPEGTGKPATSQPGGDSPKMATATLTSQQGPDPTKPALDNSKQPAGSTSEVKPASSSLTPKSDTAPSNPAASAETSPGTNKPATTPAVKPHPSPPAARFYLMNGVDVRQERLLQKCAHQELDKLSSITNQVIRLERSGALQITEAPSSVYETTFQYCIRKVFTNADIVVPVPQAVTIRVRGGR